MTSAGTVEGDELLRLFFGLPLPDEAAGLLAEWAARAYGGATGAARGRIRLLARDHLHVTLAFLGGRPRAELPALSHALREAVRGIARPVLRVERYRETERVAMLVFSDEEGRAGVLQARLSERLEALGVYRPEQRPWLPHVTVARFERRPGLRPELPALAPISPSDAALYHSVLRPSGAQYQIVEAVSLGG